ncbi:translation initiation factor eIF-2B subunit beta-like protein [Tanacetum coccineum]
MVSMTTTSFNSPLYTKTQSSSFHGVPRCLPSSSSLVSPKAAGSDPFDAITNAVKSANRHLQTFSHRERKKVSNKAMRGGVSAKFVIIDDGWQSVRMDPTSFEAKVDNTAKSDGFVDGAECNENCDALKAIIKNGLGLVDPEKVFNFYKELHSYLASAGIDGVKPRYSQLDDQGNGDRTSIKNLHKQAGLKKILSLLDSKDPNVRLHAMKVVANLATESFKFFEPILVVMTGFFLSTPMKNIDMKLITLNYNGSYLHLNQIRDQYHDGSWLSHQQMSLLQHQRENVNFLNQEISKHTLSKEFIARGLQTIVFTNSDVFAMISRVNMAHAVMANGGVIAPFGLNMIALAAQRHVSFVVLAGIHKYCQENT